MIGKIGRGGRGFKGLVSYLVNGKTKGEKDPNRVAWIAYRNLETDDPKVAYQLMRGAAALSARCKKPVYHFVVSWRADENPSREIMMGVGAATLRDLGLDEHQAMMVAHHDTDHRHLHFVVNRVNAETAKAWHASRDYARLERSLGRQARERGLIFVEGRHNTPDKAAQQRRHPRAAEYQVTQRCGQPLPLDRFSLEEIKARRAALGPVLENAPSWDVLSAQLAMQGLHLYAKGQGLVLADATGYMKLSDVGKGVRLPALESRFGEMFADYDRRRKEAERQHLAKVEDVRRAATVLTPAMTPVPGRPAIPVAVTGDAADSSSRAKPLPQPAPHAVPTPEPALAPKKPQPAERRQRPTIKLPPVAPRERGLAGGNVPTGAAARPVPVSSTSGDGGDTTGPSFHRTVAPAASAGESVRSEEQRSLAFQSLADAQQKLDIVRHFAALGIASQRDVTAAQEELIRARDTLREHQTFQEFVAEGVRDALTPKPSAKQSDDLDKEKDRDEPDRGR